MLISESLSENFKLGDLTRCSDAVKFHGIENIPREEKSLSALVSLAEEILEPVVTMYGFPQLTMGFCSPAVQRLMKQGIAPGLDQHAAHELNSRGKPLCPRGGAACDFFIDGQGSLGVAQWLVINLKFDRLYFYGDDRPIHASWSKSPSRSVVLVKRSHRTGRRFPSSISISDFLALSR